MAAPSSSSPSRTIALDEVLADLDASAGRPPDARLEVRLADQCQPVTVRHEERDVVTPPGAVRDQRELRVGHLALPPQDERLAVARRGRARAPIRRRESQLSEELGERFRAVHDQIGRVAELVRGFVRHDGDPHSQL